jgi:hypothetical protein
VLRFLVQFGGERWHPGHISLVDPVLLLVAGACSGALMLWGLGLLVPRVRRTMRVWRSERRRLQAVANAELRARTLMSELCPHGWRAQITMSEGSRVALDWAELEDESGHPAVLRRVWAPSIVEALEAMVADRRTDETLEQIEHGAIADGTLWPDA